MTKDDAAVRLQRAQALYRKTAKNPRSTDDFLADRRAEARRDEALAGRSED